MSEIKFISFDVSGTLTIPKFSDLVWHEGIPRLFAREKCIKLQEAKDYIEKEYNKVGEERLEWYDIKYWFKKFGLSDYRKLLAHYKHEIAHYPEVKDALENLSKSYKLIITSNSAREFLDLEIKELEGYFTYIFSALDFEQVKKSGNFYMKVCAALGARPTELVHVGDHWDFDFIAPREIGILSFFLDRSGKREGEFIVKDLKEFERKLHG
jgi:putative hydrolase of the HAD superfamily